MLPVYDRIESLCKEKGINVTEMCKLSGVSRSVLSDYKTGRKQSISTPNIEKIADFFEVSMDYVLCKTDIKKTPALTKRDEREITFDDFTYAFLDESEELTEENKAKLLEMAKFFKQQQDKEKSEH